MTEEVYDPKKFALSLGFTEAEADQLAKAGEHGADATNIRRVAEAKGLSSTKGTIPPPAHLAVKKHKHSYRKDGTCACGAVRKVRRSK